MNIRISFLATLLAIVLFTILISTCMLIAVATGEYHDRVMRVNVNEQTDLFEKSVDDYSSFASQLEEQKDTAASGAKSEEGLEFLVKEDKGKIITAADSLAAIPATELNARAAEAVMQDDTMNDLYVDYSSPLNKQAIIDATKIAKGQDALLANLLDKLKEIGVDCRTVKGVKEQEPAYYMQIQQTQHQDTIYNRAICEELRNQYRCSDSVSLTCKKTGKRYGEWEERTIELSGPWIYWNRRWWTYAIKWKKKRFGIHLYPNWQRSDVANSIRDHIVETLGVSDEQIHKEVNVSARGEGAINHIEGKGYIWERFRIGYKYRSSTEICEQWSEDWTERCNLNSLVKPVVNRTGQRK